MKEYKLICPFCKREIEISSFGSKFRLIHEQGEGFYEGEKLCWCPIATVEGEWLGDLEYDSLDEIKDIWEGKKPCVDTWGEDF